MKQIVYVILAVASIMLSSPVVGMNNTKTLEETVYKLLCKETIKHNATKNDNKNRLVQYKLQYQERKELHRYQLNTLVNYYEGQKIFFQPTLDNILKLSSEELQNHISSKVSPQIYEEFSKQSKDSFMNKTPIKNDLKKIMKSCIVAFEDLKSDLLDETFEQQVQDMLYNTEDQKKEQQQNIPVKKEDKKPLKKPTSPSIAISFKKNIKWAPEKNIEDLSPIKREETDYVHLKEIIIKPIKKSSSNVNVEHLEILQKREETSESDQNDETKGILIKRNNSFDDVENAQMYVGNPYILDQE